MRRVLFIALSVVAVSLTAQQADNDLARLGEAFKRDISRLPSSATPSEFAAKFADTHKLSGGQMAEILEGRLREALLALEGLPNPDAEENAGVYLAMLRHWNGPGTLALLGECALSKSERVRNQAASAREAISFRMSVHEQLEEDYAALKAFTLSAVCGFGESRIYSQKPPSGGHPRSARGIATVYQIPPERMTQVLEEAVRERLSAMEKAEGDGKARPENDVFTLIRQLRDFQGGGTPALLEECARSTSERVRSQSKSVREFINAGEGEREVMALEEVVREKLSDMEKADGRQKLKHGRDICAILPRLKDSRRADTLALLRDCALSSNEWVCYGAVEAYIAILGGGGDSASLLREVYATGRVPQDSSFFMFLQEAIGKLKGKGSHGDVEKLHAAMLEIAQVEQEASNAAALDSALCASLEGYAESVQREQALQRLRQSVDEWNRRIFDERKAEIDKTPAGKRTDLSKRFRLPPMAQKNEE